jgi:tetratricopeptide (TPR) repeat protein
MASTYHQLGNTAYLRGELDGAEEWYRKSLAIEDELGDRFGMAISYHQLGIIAQDRGRPDEAEEWYRRSLTIKKEFGDLRGTAVSYAQLGLLAEEQAQARQALEWNIRSVTLFDEFPHPETGSAPAALARLTRRLGIPALEEAWQRITGQPLPRAIRDYVTSHQDASARSSLYGLANSHTHVTWLSWTGQEIIKWSQEKPPVRLDQLR